MQIIIESLAFEPHALAELRNLSDAFNKDPPPTFDDLCKNEILKSLQDKIYEAVKAASAKG